MDTPAHFPNSKFSLIPNTIKNEKAGLNHLAYYQCRSDNTHRRSSCIRLLATVGNEKFQRAYKHRKRTGKTRREYTAIFQEYRQYENNRVWINNDSLIQKLDREKTRVQRLLEELRNRKNIDALTIDSLHKELQCLRNNIKIYQTTIDSLNRENRQLKAEKTMQLSQLSKSNPEKQTNYKKTITTERESQPGRPSPKR